MKVSYNKLWKLLIDKNMKKMDLLEAIEMSPNTLAKLGRNEDVSMDVLKRICAYLQCDVGDIMETLETRAAFHYLSKQEDDSIQFYHAYERGEITRAELMEHIPEEVIATVINEELSDKSIKGVFEQIDKNMKDAGVEHVDVIVGGPPCQAYSLVGRAQSSHMIVPMEDDPRNELYKMYTRFLTRYKPEMFVFENVAGIKSARGGAAYKNLQAHLKRVGYEFECREQNAFDFGVLQSRKRMIIIRILCHTIRRQL